LIVLATDPTSSKVACQPVCCDNRPVATLQIEHPISDLGVWRGAFARFEQARTNAGVRSQAVHQPVDDDKYIYVRLEFDSVERAQAFKQFLETNVWNSREASPGLAGTPRARILTPVEIGSVRS
jgi:hypothetical protein